MPEDHSAAGFRTALFGFKKTDVLACIEKMAAEGQEKEQKAEAHAKELEASVDSLRTDQDILLQKTRELCSQLTEKDKRTAELESQAEALREQLRRSEDEAGLYKKKLFTKEQETIGLRKENADLTSRLRRQEQAAEEAQDARQQAQRQMELQVAAAEESANLKVLSAEENAERRIAQAQQQAQLEAVHARAAMTAGAQEIADSVSILKEQLADVDAKIAAAAGELQRTTAALHAALNGTEENLLLLGAQMQQFPQPAPGAKPPAAPKEPQEAAAKKEPRPARGAESEGQGSVHKSLSALLLDKLTRMLSE